MVIAAFARSFYLANAAGELACIGPRGLGCGPLNVPCELPAGLDFQACGLRAGDPAARDGEVLLVGGRFAFSLRNAIPWRQTNPPSWDTATLARGLAALAAATHKTGAGGFAPLVAALARNDPVTACASPLLQFAAPGIAALAEWLAGSAERTPQAAAILVGLGPGLTPSGDDLVGGAMIALHALGRADMALQLADWVMPLARERTGAISFAHLACAADGEGCAALHDLLNALFAVDEEGIAAGVVALAALGHSSGWDMLAGAALACASLSA